MRGVRVVYHCEDGNWWADSSDPGLETFAAGGRSFEETRRLATEGAAFHLGEQVSLTEVFEDGTLVDQHTMVHPVSVESSVFAAPGSRSTTRAATISLGPAPVRPMLVRLSGILRGSA